MTDNVMKLADAYAHSDLKKFPNAKRAALLKIVEAQAAENERLRKAWVATNETRITAEANEKELWDVNQTLKQELERVTKERDAARRAYGLLSGSSK